MPLDNLPADRSASGLRCRARGYFARWLADVGGTLVVTTYTAGKVVLVGSHEGRLRYRTLRFARPMGIAVDRRRLALAVQRQILVFPCRAAALSERTPARESYQVGKLDVHDVAFGARGIYFANTKFNCIAQPSRTKHFVHHWQPPFITELIAQDRCHLNGVGMRDGVPTLATAFCATEHTGGWREENRFTSGVVIDIPRNELLAGGLCMPHSPRFQQDAWWLCNSGWGTLCRLNTESGEIAEVCALPGFTRGLNFVNHYAVVGLSKIREKHILDAPPVRARHRRLIAGIAVVDTSSGKQVGALEFVRGGNEVYDVAHLPADNAER